MESRMGRYLSRGRGSYLEEESLGETEGEATPTRWDIKIRGFSLHWMSFYL